MRLDDHSEKLRSVESLVNRCSGFDSTLGQPGGCQSGC